MRNLCTIDGCTKFVVGQGLCRNHYMMKRRNGAPEPRRGRPKPPCVECGGPSAYLGLCLRHYHASRRAQIEPRLHPGRECAWCLGLIPETRNARAVYCSSECKHNAINHRARQADDWTTRLRERNFAKTWGPLGFTLADYDVMLAEQNNRCAICDTSEWAGRHGTPCTDHDHATGRIRGLLCSECNTGIGTFRDNPARLRAAADYLERALTAD